MKSPSDPSQQLVVAWQRDEVGLQHGPTYWTREAIFATITSRRGASFHVVGPDSYAVVHNCLSFGPFWPFALISEIQKMNFDTKVGTPTAWLG